MAIIRDEANHRAFKEVAGGILVRIPSVTDVLSIVTEAAYSAIPRRVLKAAQVRGKTVHSLIADFETGKIDDTDLRIDAKPDHAEMVRAFVEWRSTNRLKTPPIAAERWLASARYDFHGTFDLVYETEAGALVLVDVKTGAKGAGVTHLQTSAYAWLLEELSGVKISRRVEVRLNADDHARATWYEKKDQRRDFADFLALKAAWNVKNKVAFA